MIIIFSTHLVLSTTGDFIDKFKDSRTAISALQFSPGKAKISVLRVCVDKIVKPRAMEIEGGY